jgi:hypothetical protein
LNNFIKLIIYSFFPLLIGGLIYIGFRTDSLLMFNWFSYLGVIDLVKSYRSLVYEITLPEFFVYSLPNGLWTFSFLMFVYITTNKKFNFFLTLFCILIIIGLEIFQLTKLISGTFCLTDLLTNIFFIVLFLIIKERITNETFKSNWYFFRN